jgi:hypothetical protein
LKIDNIHKTNSSSEGNTSNSEESQQVTQQTNTTPTNKYIGKVIISDRAKHNKFYVCVTKDENIEVGSTILVAEDVLCGILQFFSIGTCS